MITYCHRSPESVGFPTFEKKFVQPQGRIFAGENKGPVPFRFVNPTPLPLYNELRSVVVENQPEKMITYVE